MLPCRGHQFGVLDADQARMIHAGRRDVRMGDDNRLA